MKKSRFTYEQIIFALKQLEEKNSKLKHIVADLCLDKAMLEDVLTKKALKPSRKRELATDLMERFGSSMRMACSVINLSRVVYLCKSNVSDNSALVMRMKEITQIRVHYGCRRVHEMLMSEGFRNNHMLAKSTVS